MNDGRKFLVCIILSLALIFGGIALLTMTDIEMWVFLVMVAVSIALVSVPIFFLNGTEAVFDGASLTLKAPFVDLRIDLSDIQGLELRREFSPGLRTYGFGGFRRGYGDFSNKEFGSYTYAGDKTIPAFILVKHHGNRILVFNYADEARTTALYNSLKSGTRAEGTVARSGTAADRSPYRRTVLIIAGITVTAILVIVAALFLFGHVNASLESDHLHVDAPMVDENIRYTEITVSDVELRDNLDYGSRRAGYASFDILSGTFQNSEFGKYTLAVHSDVSRCIVVHHGGSVLAFNLGSDAETQSFYNDLLLRL